MDLLQSSDDLDADVQCGGQTESLLASFRRLDTRVGRALLVSRRANR